MKNLTKFLTGTFLGASLLFGAPQNSQAQFEKIKVNYPVEGDKKTYVDGYKDSWDDGPVSGIHYEKGNRIQTWTHKNDSVARCEIIDVDENGKLTNKVYEIGHNLDDGDWKEGYSESNRIKKYSGEQENFPLETQDRIKKIMNMDKTCNHDWRYFLNKTVSDKNDISSYSIYYYFWDEDNFPEKKQAYAYGPEEYGYHFLAKLEFEDTDGDNIYDKILLENTVDKKSFDKFVYELDYDSGNFDYSFYYKNSRKVEKNSIPFGDMGKGVGRKLKEILTKGKIDCSSNDLIPFLYDEYYKWNED